MFKLWNNSKKDNDSQSSGGITWDPQAKAAIDQALQQAPVPPMLKGRVRKELEKAAEEAARKEGRSIVQAQDVMNGMLAKLPANMRQKVEDAMKEGPEGLKKLQNELGNHK